MTPISANLQRFSGEGLREVRGLINNANRAVDSINSAVEDFTTNPSRLIYGGDDVKQYDGRTRR